MAFVSRLFIAIDLPKPVRWRLGRLLVQPPRGVRAVQPSQFHITLHFLGDVEDARRMPLIESLGRVRGRAFTIAIRGTGVFPPEGRPSVLWAGVAESPDLLAVHAAVAREIESCGLAVERRPYQPHVTLARLTPAVGRSWTRRFLAETADLSIEAFVVERFQLYRSRKLDGASEHSVEAAFPLEERR